MTWKTLQILVAVVFALGVVGCKRTAEERASETESDSAKAGLTSHGNEEPANLPDWAQVALRDARAAETSIRDELQAVNEEIEAGSRSPELYYRRGKLRRRVRQYVGFALRLKYDDMALEDFNKAHKLAAPTGHALALLGAWGVHAGRFDPATATPYMERAAALAPDHLQVRIVAAICQGWETGQWDDSIDQLQAIAKEPEAAECPRLWSALGYVYLLAERYSDAETAYRKTLALRPSFSLFNSLGLVYQGLGKLELAEQFLGIALESNIGDVYAGINLGQALTSSDDPEKNRQAVRVLRSVLELAPTIPAAWNNLGGAYSNLGQYTESIDAYQTAARLLPQYSDAYYNMGCVYFGWGKYGNAIDAYNRALRNAPVPEKILFNLAIAHAEAQQFEEAERVLRHAGELTPEDHRVWNSLGYVFLNAGRYDDARRPFKMALAIDRKLFRPRNGLGAIMLHRGELDGAADAFETALGAHLDDANAIYGVIQRLLEHADSKEALHVANMLVERLPDAVAPYVIRARVHINGGRADAAVADATRAIELDANAALAYLARGLARRLQGANTAAIDDLRESYRLNPDNEYSLLLWRCVPMTDVQAADVDRELADAIERLPRDSWGASLMRLVRGTLDPTELLELAESDERRCKAFYYVGERALHEGDSTVAQAWFQRCIDTGVVYFRESVLAQARLTSNGGSVP